MATDQSVTITMSAPFADGDQDNKIEITWTCTDLGVVSAALAALFAADQYDFGPKPSKINGYLVKVSTNPSATAPTDQYDITLLDSDSIDIAGGNLSNRSSTLSEDWVPSTPIPIDSEITFTIANAGDAKIGTATLFISSGI